MKENIDYAFMEESETPEDTISLKILTAPFEDVVYRYNTVKIYEKEIEGELQGVLEFDFEVLDNNQKELEENAEFQQRIGDILSHLLQTQECKIGTH